MKNYKKLRTALFLSLVFLSQNCFALGLGGIILKSEKDSPLNAHILVHSFKLSDIGTISVRNAPKKYFKKYSIESNAYVRALRYKLVFNEENQSIYIDVRHRSPPKKKVLKFVVEVTWEDGKLVKPFTLLVGQN